MTDEEKTEFEEEVDTSLVLPPSKIPEEMALLGALLCKSELMVDVLDVLTTQDFYDPFHRIIFACMEKMFDQDIPIDVVTVQHQLNQKDQLDTIGGLAYLAELAHETPSPSTAVQYAKDVKEVSVERETRVMVTSMHETMRDTKLTHKERIQKTFALPDDFDFQEEKVLDFIQQSDEYLRIFEERTKSDGGLTGVPTGFRELDQRTRGLQNGNLIIIAADTGQGKTNLALNIAAKTAEEKHVAVFSLEMQSYELHERLIAMQGVLMDRLQAGDEELYGEKEFIQACKYRSRLKMTIDETGGITPSELKQKCLKIQKSHGELGLVVVDYLQLMQVEKCENDTARITKISNSLKALAKTLNCPVIALAQFNREKSKKNNARPEVTDLKGSSSIEQDADIILLLHNEDYYREQRGELFTPNHEVDIEIAKARSIPKGKFILRSEFQYARFQDFPEDYQSDNFQPADSKLDKLSGNQFAKSWED